MYRAFQSAKKKFDRLASFGKQPYLTSQQVNESKKILRRFFKRRVEMENQVFAVEKEIKIDLGDGMHLVGYIDRIDKVKDGEYVIVDYKTSKTPYDINKNNQLDIYALGFIQALGGPNIKVHKQLDFIKAGSVTPRQLHDNLANEQIENNLYDLASEIRDKKTTEHNNAEAWIPHDNDFCWACDFKDRCYRDRGITESIFGDD
jgi:RecB family exonuclease